MAKGKRCDGCPFGYTFLMVVVEDRKVCVALAADFLGEF